MIIEVHNWEDFNKTVFSDSFDNTINRFRSRYIFRGLSYESYDLITSLQRVCNKKMDLEEALLRNFKKYASLEIKNLNFWEILSLAQHHGLPTRLMDWTYSPYVAAHFATEDYSLKDKPCAIWCIDFVKCKEYLPEELKNILDKCCANSFSIEMLEREDFSSIKSYELKSSPYPIFFEPPSIDSRIINQYALFSMMSDPKTNLTEWIKEHENIGFKIVITPKARKEIRDKLDQVNISERIIYPGIDGLCKWLTRHYTPNP